ncbi:MAG TPA: hypothetical protein VKX25_12895 [Bryobacteraceae bacterium]|jgi:hypothetical protein|nr:hypothetical protein [Bryobacteraceae bacterium]
MDELSKKEMVEGPEAFKRFDALVGKVLSVSKEELLRREVKHQKAAHLRGKKRGPKRVTEQIGRS